MIFLLVVLAVAIVNIECSEDCYLSDKTFHHLSAVSIQDIVTLNKVLNSKSNIKEIFDKINLIRPVGSENHVKVKEYIKRRLLDWHWSVDDNTFSMNTLIGPTNFTNIIGTQNVTKARRLVLACHYDSLQMDGFYGSTDSAMPCAMMLSIAEIITPLLMKNVDLDLSLELIFFDGEEAFVKWTATDSLYGSRHLANLWSGLKDDKGCSRLNKMDAMILLDLLGAQNPKFYIFNNGNYKLFESIARIEGTITQQQNIFKATDHPYFNTRTVDSQVEDDHVPFLERGVSIVHLIPIPFPPQWHKISDNAKGIDWKTSKDLELIFSVFLVQYFHLGNQLPSLHTDDL